MISTTADGALSVFATDVDGDGDTDVLSASVNDDKIAWYESDGGSPPTFTERVISTTGQPSAPVPFSRRTWTVTGTPTLSQRAALDDKIAWYENDGGSPPTFTGAGDLDQLPSRTSASVFATDVDGDGDTDVLGRPPYDDSDKIAWYESDGGSPSDIHRASDLDHR